MKQLVTWWGGLHIFRNDWSTRNSWWKNPSHLHFALGPANSVAGPGASSFCHSQITRHLEVWTPSSRRTGPLGAQGLSTCAYEPNAVPFKQGLPVPDVGTEGLGEGKWEQGQLGYPWKPTLFLLKGPPPLMSRHVLLDFSPTADLQVLR